MGDGGGRDSGGDPGERETTSTRPLHSSMSALASVFVGGVVGTLARVGVEEALPHRPSGWPVATFVINIVGAFVLGLVLENLARRGPDIGVRQRVRLLAGTGFCGAFTTYSTFALEAVLLTRDGHWSTASAYGAGTVVLGGVAAWAGIVVGAAGHRRRSAR
ncbi:CrcB family protein [Rhodococcus sp. RS1C4]|uniref:fluoride efflux transporter FluC n=1 Tax=Nocardiaceae TaxID=85025 RepID=UPI000365533A|nr:MULTISPECIES: CrcB family protein [Rhodococcus]OZC46024.1 CrcB family protein [Rhodococcus sp. 06-621-2]OZC48625.1 CrcB family protein [Rhodococcus sp. RS1C4]OZC85460.1 CrcB family protein [Rhodococcus sp. 06-418-1B]OZE79357.1 CrcB family protein [Rhodococcus sp. 15-649-1-2]